MPNLSLILGTTKQDTGVFVVRDFEKGEILLEFKGELYYWPPNVILPKGLKEYDMENDHFLQVDISLYMGPSGDIDDYVNHSCDPNTGLYYKGQRIFLIAIRKIYKHEEITWDYSTNMDEESSTGEDEPIWTMKCNCGVRTCRKIIQDFKRLPSKVQKRYLYFGIVSPFIVRQLAEYSK
jgi:SET domain-containing protein